jgi:hypothetical protein
VNQIFGLIDLYRKSPLVLISKNFNSLNAQTPERLIISQNAAPNISNKKQVPLTPERPKALTPFDFPIASSFSRILLRQTCQFSPFTLCCNFVSPSHRPSCQRPDDIWCNLGVADYDPLLHTEDYKNLAAELLL